MHTHHSLEKLKEDNAHLRSWNNFDYEKIDAKIHVLEQLVHDLDETSNHCA